VDAGGQTDVADGLREAIETVGESPGRYGRSCASKAIVLLLQGTPNRWPGYPNCGPRSCCEHDLYLPNDGTDDENKARDCAVYYADVAQEEGIVIYTVGLGADADSGLLQEIADRTEGSYFVAPRATDLEGTYQSIADRIVIDAPSLATSQHAEQIPVVPGQALTYTLVVTNTGGVDLQATISEVLPVHVTYAGPISWTPTITAPGGVWTQTVMVTVEAGYAGSLTNTFVVTTQGCLAVTNTLVLKPDLEVSKHSSLPVRPGEQLTYTIAITNRGAFDLHTTVTDVLPAHVTLVDGPLTWTPTIPAPSGVWTATVAVTVEEGYVGPLTNTVLASTEEGVRGVYTHTLRPGIEASKVAHTDVTQPGRPLTYTLAVTNTGDFELALTITDVLPAYVTPGGPLSWSPTLTEAGSVWRETVVVTVGGTYAGPLSNVLQVANERERMATCTETVTVEAWWLYLPLVMRLRP